MLPVTHSQGSAARGLLHCSKSVLTVGFVPMIDAAVLIVAKELNLFAKYGLKVKLSREVGWASVRERLLHEELDAAHAPASMALAIRCGIGVVARQVVTGFVMALNGSAITLSNELWELGVRDARSLAAVVAREKTRTFTFGAVLELSTQHYNLRRWLKSGGIDPDRDVRLVMMPSPLMHRRMQRGDIDGYCVGEPWNSMLAINGEGWIAATSAELQPLQVEKVLLVTGRFAETHEHLAMIAALIEAARFCQNPANRMELVRILAQPCYLDVPEAAIANSLRGPLFTGREMRSVPEMILFSGRGVNVPDRAKGRAVFKDIAALGVTAGNTAFRPDAIGRIFRQDLYQQALQLVNGPTSLKPTSSSEEADDQNPGVNQRHDAQGTRKPALLNHALV